MPSIIIKDNEPIDLILRRLKKTIERSGLLKELRKREFYEPPSKIKKKKISNSKKKMSRKNIRGVSLNYKKKI